MFAQLGRLVIKESKKVTICVKSRVFYFFKTNKVRHNERLFYYQETLTVEVSLLKET